MNRLCSYIGVDRLGCESNTGGHKNRAKRASLDSRWTGCSERWDNESQEVSRIWFEKNGLKEEEQARKEKEREEKRAEEQANSQLAQM